MSRFDKYRADRKTRLSRIDSGATPFLRGSVEDGEAELEALAEKLDKLQNLLRADGSHKLLLVLQGMDTSGKDGTIRWVFSRTSPLGVAVTAFKAPTEEERARDFLWRCHAVVPRAGDIMVWNRSHYEDLWCRWSKAGSTRRRSSGDSGKSTTSNACCVKPAPR